MRRFDRELRSLGKPNLQYLAREIELVLQNSDPLGRPKRRVLDTTHSVFEFRDWHLTDATRTLAPPPKPGTPTIFAAMGDKLRIVLRRDGAVFWSDLPATVPASEPLAYAMSSAHARHVAAQWQGRYGKGGAEAVAWLRLATGDALMEFYDTPGEPAVTDFDRKARITSKIVDVDWDEVWAQPPQDGVVFAPAQLTKVIQLLLLATRQADREYVRILEEQRDRSTRRRQDHGALWFDAGVGRVLLGSCYYEAQAPGFEALRFGIGRRDAETLIRAMRLMSVGRRRDLAKKTGRAVGPPRWTRVGALNVVTNGDVGFAFPDAQGAHPVLRLPGPDDAIARANWRYCEFAKRFPLHEVVSQGMDQAIELQGRDDGPVFFAESDIGDVTQQIPLGAADAGKPFRPRLAGVTDGVRFNLLDLACLAGALSSADVRCDILGAKEADVFGLRLEQTTEDLAFRAWVARLP